MFVCGFGILALLACGDRDRSAERQAGRDLPPVASKASPPANRPAAGAAAAWANVEPTQPAGSVGPRGTVRFEPAGDGLRVHASFQNLPPGDHDFAVYSRADCSAAGSASAGERFKLGKGDEGGTGSLGQVKADSSGRGEFEGIVPGAELEGEHSIVGHTVVVHEGQGDATKGIACGAIES